MWEVPHSTGQRPLDSRGNLQLWVRGHLALVFALYRSCGPRGASGEDMSGHGFPAFYLGKWGCSCLSFSPTPWTALGCWCTWLAHMVGRGQRMSLLGYLSPLTRKPKRRHLSQQKGHPAHWLIPGAGEMAGSPLCPPPSGRGWCPLPTVVALGEVLTVCSASVSPSGKWGQGY